MKKITILFAILLCVSMLLGSCMMGGGPDITLPAYSERTTDTVASSDSDEPTGTAENTDDETTSVPGDETTAAPSTDETTDSVTSTEPPEQTTDAGTTSDGYGLVGASDAVDSSFFDDVAFIGDSISLKLKTYCMNGALGKAQFFTVGSFSLVNALTPVSANSCHPSYRGEKMLAEDCIAKSGAKKVYIMLGMNDLAYGIDSTIERYETFIARILKKSPDVEIYVQSMTPMLKSSSVWGNSLNNDKIQEYNGRLLEMCKKNKWYFIDIFPIMWDSEKGELRYDFCGDPGTMGMHMTSAGCKAWVEYLLTHTVK
ncbi:MAG: GDSL-type esterase/lipase family protein [Eubacteriales bacterium]